MKKILFVCLTVLFAFPLFAFTAEEGYFPLDKGRVWIFDDGAEETITGFQNIEMQGADIDNMMGGRGSRDSRAGVFAFSAFNHERREFYVVGNRVFEFTSESYRLWFDFAAAAGSNWKMEWKAMRRMQNGARDPKFSDLNEGATMRMVEKFVTVETPAGTFENCIHFRIEREGVADASYVDIWFAKGVGVVQRQWDTIAGPRLQRLARMERPELEDRPYRMDIALDKRSYDEGETVNLTVTVLNWSDSDITLEFPSALMVDYVVDGEYRWSDNNAVAEVESELTIPARDVHKWEFALTPEDYPLGRGAHVIEAELAGTELRARQAFVVTAEAKPLPEGIAAVLSLEKNEYAVGEKIGYMLTLSNANAGEVTLEVPDRYTLWHGVGDLFTYPADRIGINEEMAELTVPANGQLALEGIHVPDMYLLKPGDYDFLAGLRGYEGEWSAPLTITDTLGTATIAGVVRTPESSESDRMFPVEGAEIKLIPEIPRQNRGEMSNLPAVELLDWTAVTGADGAFSIADVPMGVFFILDVRAKGFEPFQRTLRPNESEVDLTIVLRSELERSKQPFNVKRNQIGDLVVAFGTDKSAYKLNEPINAFLKITNTGTEAVSFTFDHDHYLFMTLADMDNKPLVAWGSPVVQEDQSSEVKVDIPAGASVTLDDGPIFILDSVVPGTPARFILTGALLFSGSSIDGLEFDNENPPVAGRTNIAIVNDEIMPRAPKRLMAVAHDKQIIADFKEDLDAALDIVVSGEDIEGEIGLTELRENLRGPLQARKFLKMVEIEVDETLRENMEEAHVRIYFDPAGYGEDFDPQRLIIAHWHDDIDSDAPPTEEWTELDTVIDTVNNFVEATTTQFSSFGLFIDDETTAVETAVPEEFALDQNSPNPFNPSTVIGFSLPESGRVTLEVYNIMGQVVARLIEDDYLPAGAHHVLFDGAGQASGVYFYRLRTGHNTATKKMLLIK